MILNVNDFIAEHVTDRSYSMFKSDLEKYQELLLEQISNRSVLVIGGAGTIGLSFIKALLKYGPEKLLVVDQSENELTELTRDLRSDFSLSVPDQYITYAIDFSSNIFVKLLHEKGPFDIVANFAAHKHVRSEKDHFAIEAMIKNNVYNAYDLLCTLTKEPPAHFFCVSTDKASNPVNVMGASKKLMEDVILSFSDEIKITSARFANVAFSNGSLLYGYLQRLMKRQPLSCPKDIKRYFVSPRESGQICLLSCITGFSGDILFPKLMENSMKSFREITYDFLDKLNLVPLICDSERDAKHFLDTLPITSKEYPVYFFETSTTGEKLFEEFYTDQDEIIWDRFEALGVIRPVVKNTRREITEKLSLLRSRLDSSNGSKHDIIAALKEIVPNFEHRETGVNLDQRM